MRRGRSSGLLAARRPARSCAPAALQYMEKIVRYPRAGSALMNATVLLFSAVSIFLFIASEAPVLADDDQPNRIRIEYGDPKTPGHLALSGLMKEHHALEKFQEIFSPFRLPIELTLKMQDCSGVSNAWYARPTVTICYEYLEDIRKNMPAEPPSADSVFAGITQADVVFGQFFYAVAHEMGHAMFDLLDVPLFGRSEDAADEFATYMMLELGKDQATRLILGAAYSYKDYVKNPNVCVPLIAFADAHGAPMQRFYNLLCIAYGADPQLFGGLAAKGYLPKNRADSCKSEFDEVSYAFQHVINPHLDPQLAKEVLNKNWLPHETSPPPLPDSMHPGR
jgi:hypothetical protein